MGSLPIDKVEYGVNYACFTQNEKHYICACQKKSIENRLRLWKEYFCKFGYYDMVTGITYDACDPELRRKVLGLPNCIDSYIDYSCDVTEQIEFKPYICHECNSVPAAFFSPLHPRSKKWRNMPYRINNCIALGIYPCKSLPPHKGRYYFFLDDIQSFRTLHDCTFAGAILNNFQCRSKMECPGWFESLNKRFNKDEQRKLLCAPGYFDDETEKKIYWYMFDLRRSIKARLNNFIGVLLSTGVSSIDYCDFDIREEQCRIYDYVIKDGKIVMDKLLEPFFRTDLNIFLKYAENLNTLGFCFKIRAYNRFYEAIEHLPVERIADEIIFAPNVIADADRLKIYSQSNYFRLLAHGLQIAKYYFNVVLLVSDSCKKSESLNILFDITEEYGLQNKLVPIIHSFYKKNMNLSYYDVKRDYAELLLRILSFKPNLDKYSVDEFAGKFAETFSKELKEANIEFTSDDILLLFRYVYHYLKNFIDEEFPLRDVLCKTGNYV